MTLSSVFLSHGAPDLAIVPSAAHEFLKHLGGRIERPRALIVVSAHNMTHVPTVASGPSPHTVYDFGGFDPALREMTYPARGDAVLAGQVMEALQAAGIEAVFDGEAGYDHGVWVPLSLIYPDADIPIVQLSVQPHQSGEWHVALGRALAPLLTDGVLLIGSGGITHNLRAALGARSDDAPKPPEWVTDFSDWIDTALREARWSELGQALHIAPMAQQNHPTTEHFYPFLVALGAGGLDPEVERLHTSTTYGVLMMDSYGFSQRAMD